MEPQDITHGTGAIVDVLDARDIQYENIAMGVQAFDWNKGFDIEEELAKALGTNSTKMRIPNKDQDGSSSCGGQAWSYYGGVLEAFSTASYEERSAKFIYSQTFVGNGGSAGRTNSQLCCDQGWAREAVCSSYDAGMAPGEAFMQRKSDITPEARNDASKAKGLVYANVATNIDLFATAIQNNHGMVVGITGQNNGTWRTAFPKPPVNATNTWNHWMYAGKAKLINGKKYIGLKQSWGDGIGEDGWQWIGEDYFSQDIPVLRYAIWSGWTMVFKGSDPAFKHTFTLTLKKGSRGAEVEALQKALTLEGMYKGKIDGDFGPATKASVQTFQLRYSLNADGVVGPKTNAKLNALYGN